MQAANAVTPTCEKNMADVPQAIAEKAKTVSGNDSAPAFNLVDLAAPGTKDKQQTLPRTTEVLTMPAVAPALHLTRPAPDADLNHSFALLDPGAWDNSAALRKIYENGVLKLLADPDGKQQFGLRISNQKSDRTGVVPIRAGHLDDKGVSLEYRWKF